MTITATNGHSGAPAQSPVAMNFERFYSQDTKGRVRSALKELRPYMLLPGMISFGVGIPHPETFPISSMTLSVPFAGKSVFVPGPKARSPSDMLPLEEYSAPAKNEPLRPDLEAELQYSSTYGTEHLLEWLREHIERVHAPQYSDWNILLTAANTDGMDAVLRTCMDRGDYLLAEEFAYPGLLAPAGSLGLRPIGVPMDEHGVNAEALESILADWDEELRGKPRPKLIVLVPTCSNPSGVTIPEFRKHEIYAVCRKWDMLIIEDDPYYFLQTRTEGTPTPRTFLSIDTDGRVVRVDSFSKVVAPGARLGFITAHKTLLEKLMNSRESATQCPSGISIAAVSAVLRAWGGHEGFEKKYVPRVSDIYTTRGKAMERFLNTHVPSAALSVPTATGGMFLWVRLRIENHPDFPSKSVDDIAHQVFEALVAARVLCIPGKYFKPEMVTTRTLDEEARNAYMRIAFTLPPIEDMEEGAKRLGAALKEQWKL